MSKLIFSFLIIAFDLTNQTLASDLLTIKHKKFGYEIQYPKTWMVYTDDDYDEDTKKPIPIEFADSVLFELKDSRKRSDCNDTSDCQVGFICSYDGSQEKFDKSMKFINESIRRGYIPSVAVRNEEVRINGSKAELIVKDDVDKNRYRIHLLVHCTNKSIFRTGGINRYNIMYASFKDVLEKPISIESLFNEQKAQIINSFKCPAADFVYKPEKKKK